MRNILIIIAIFLIISSCSGQSAENVRTSKVSDQCKSLNDSAVNNIQLYYGSLDEGDLNNASELLHKAIQCDSSYFLALSNLSVVYSLKSDYWKAIDILDRMLELTDENLEILVHKGTLYEKLGDKNSADSIYKRVDVEYLKKIDQSPDIALISNYALFLAISQNKDSALSFINKQLINYQDSEELQMLKLTMESFDKEEYLKSIGAIE